MPPLARPRPRSVTVPDRWDEQADFVVIGSGAAGATAFVDLARAGADVLLLEEGGWFRREDFRPDLFSGLANLWRDFGGQVATGRSAFPVVQGCCVGGSTVINGAVMHRLPRAIWDAWIEDPALRDALAWDALQDAAVALERDLGVRQNLADLLPGLPMSDALDRLGWRHQAMWRAAPGCQNTNRCGTGCPSGGKGSMERTLIPEALALGARLRPRCRAERILRSEAGATGVLARERDVDRRTGRGRHVRIRARRAVLVAAGAVHSPLLLRRSGLRSEHIGRHFQCHIGGTVIAEFPRPAAEILGPSFGYEVFPAPGIKLSSVQAAPSEIALGGLPAVGRELVALVRRLDRISVWNTSVRSAAEGTVRGRWLGLPRIRFTPARADFEQLRNSAFHLARLLFEAGAQVVYPGIAGMERRLTEPASIDRIRDAPLAPTSYMLNVSHLFGTCRMAGDPARGVVAPSFRTHEVPGLYVIDASVFPTNVGTNPQLAIMTLARHATRGILACS